MKILVKMACNNPIDNEKTHITGMTDNFFNRLAEIVGEYLRKGSKVFVEGSLRTRKWQDKSGQDRYTTEIVASSMQMLDSRGGAGGGSFGGAPAEGSSFGDGPSSADFSASPAMADGGFDDDIPF